jgi:hypothetical protein
MSIKQGKPSGKAPEDNSVSKNARKGMSEQEYKAAAASGTHMHRGGGTMRGLKK